MTALIGMSSPPSEWATRVSEVGSGLKARRIFSDITDFSGEIAIASTAISQGMWPIMSMKIPNNNWSAVTAGHYDTQLRSLHTALNTLTQRDTKKVFITLHHEPAGNGTASDWSKMLIHALPILKGGVNSIKVGPIANGFWWSSRSQGLTDSQIAAWLPTKLLQCSDIIAADCYQGGDILSPGEDAGVKIKNLVTWTSRVGVRAVGVPEFNGITATAVTAAGNAALSSTKIKFACVFNSNQNQSDRVDWLLTGDRLKAFKATLAKSG